MSVCVGISSGNMCVEMSGADRDNLKKWVAV